MERGRYSQCSITLIFIDGELQMLWTAWDDFLFASKPPPSHPWVTLVTHYNPGTVKVPMANIAKQFSKNWPPLPPLLFTQTTRPFFSFLYTMHPSVEQISLDWKQLPVIGKIDLKQSWHRLFFVATCTLLPSGGLLLLGLSRALCLGEVKTASFEIFHNWNEIKHFYYLETRT